MNMDARHYWEENGHAVKYDNYNSNDGFGRTGELNFAAQSEDEAEYAPGIYKKGKVSRQDPMSHRIIEKRRRDRMNNCLADLSRLIPPEYLKKGRGRVEKTEIIEMAIRHIKFLQDRVNAERQGAERAGLEYRAGYQEAVAEALRFLVEVQGFGPADGLCLQLASHLQRHCDIVTKDPSFGDKQRSLGSSSETTSSSGSLHGFGKVVPRPEPPPTFPEPYEEPSDLYVMECDRVSLHQLGVAEDSVEVDGRIKREPALRKVRKPEHTDDYLHSYKFKNSIERRFSRSQDSEPQEIDTSRSNGVGAHKVYSHKRRRAAKPQPSSTSTSASNSTSTSTEDPRDTSPQDTSSQSPHQHQYDKPPPPTQYVPVFALNALGKYYVPLSVDYACIARQLGGVEERPLAALHPVTIHVNFTPCLDCRAPASAPTLKRDPDERRYRPG